MYGSFREMMYKDSYVNFFNLFFMYLNMLWRGKKSEKIFLFDKMMDRRKSLALGTW